MNDIKDKDVEAWLSECRTKSTRNAYVYGSGLFFAWLMKERNISLDQFKTMSPKEMKTLVLTFQNSEPKSEGRVYKSKHVHRDTGTNEHIKEPRRLSNNAINMVLTAMQSFCMYLEKPLLLKGKRVRIEDDTHSHYFANGDLGKMYDVCDLKGKAIISTAVSLGWEVGDFLALDRKLVEAHISKAESEGKRFVFFECTRTKTNVPRLAVLNTLAIKSLKDWLEVNSSEKLFDMTVSGITKFIQTTAKKANIKTIGNVRFHRIRAWVFNSLLKAGFSELESKYVVGKAIAHSDSTYLRLKETIEEKYPRVYEEYLNIKPERLSPIVETAVRQQSDELVNLRAQVRSLTELVESLKNSIQGDVMERVNEKPQPILIMNEQTKKQLEESKTS